MLQTQLDIYFKNYTRALSRLNTHIKLLQPHPKFLSFYQQCLSHELQTLIRQNKITEAINTFKTAPKLLQEDTNIIKLFIQIMNKNPEEFKFLIKMIRKQLKNHSTNNLFKLLPLLPDTNLWVKELEHLTMNNNRNPSLLLALGQLKSKQKLWGSAIQLLNESIDLYPNLDAYKELAKIYLELNQHEQALECLQKVFI
jgi:tetratricopeptide (TPR) repeat protein